MENNQCILVSTGAKQAKKRKKKEKVMSRIYKKKRRKKIQAGRRLKLFIRNNK